MLFSKGFGIVKNAYEGNAEFDDGISYEDWLWSQPSFGVDVNNLKTTFAGMFGNDQDKLNSFRKQNPDKQILLDNAQNPYFEDGNKKVYLDMPGLDAGDLVDFLGEGSTYTVGGALTSPIKNAMTRTIAGGAAQGTANVVNQNLAGRENLDLGEAGLSATGGALFEAIPAVYNKIRNAKAGNYNLTGEADDAVKFADEQDLPIFYDDVSQSGSVKKTGQQIDEIPFLGGVKSRQKQNIAQHEAAEKLTKKYALPDSELDDVHGLVSGGAKRHLERSQEIAHRKFQNAYKELNKVGDFNVSEIKIKAQKLINEQISKGSAADGAIVRELQKYSDIPAGNFEHWSGIRSDLTTKIRDLSKGVNENIGTKAIATLKQMNQVLNKSLDDVANKSGSSNQWRNANAFYDAAVIRYKRGALKNAMKEDNPERMLDLMTGVGKGTGNDSKHVANQVYNSLDKQGKAAVRHGMMQKAYTEALQDTGAFSPAKYASMLERYSNRLGVALNKEDKAFVEGLRKYMRFTQNAGGYAANIKTGQKAVGTIYGLAAGASAIQNPVATGIGSLGVIGLKRLFRTPRGRSFMLAMSSIPEGKTPPPQLLQDLARFLAVKPSEE